VTTTPLFAIYCDATHQPGLQHETLTIEQRKHWIGWIGKVRAEFRAVHPEYVEPNGGVKADHHDVFVQFCAMKYPARRSA
jgi:hypothetical protein